MRGRPKCVAGPLGKSRPATFVSRKRLIVGRRNVVSEHRILVAGDRENFGADLDAEIAFFEVPEGVGADEGEVAGGDFEGDHL